MVCKITSSNSESKINFCVLSHTVNVIKDFNTKFICFFANIEALRFC